MTANNGLKWENPPAHGNSKGDTDWLQVFEALQTRPGEWAVIYEQAEGQSEGAARNRRNVIANLAVRRGVNTETKSRLVAGRIKVYARVIL